MLPNLGVGIGYRRQLDRAISENLAQINWLEIVADNFLPLTPRRRDRLEYLMGTRTCIPHGVDLSLGSPDKPSTSHLRSYVELVKLMAPPWHSDHLAYTHVGNINLVHFVPPPRDLKTVLRIADRVKELQDLTQTLFLLENVAATSDSGGSMSPVEFSNAITERADCGLLLDLANLYADGVNFKFDPIAYMDQLDLSRVVQVHIAGGIFQNGRLCDTHNRPVPEEVWALLEVLTSRVEINGILLERDADFPPFPDLMDELQKARRIAEAAKQCRKSVHSHTASAPEAPRKETIVLARSAIVSSQSADYTHDIGLIFSDRDSGVPESRFKRWNHLKTWFPATVLAMSKLYGRPWTDEAAKDLASGYPRVITDDDRFGVREAELYRFRYLLRNHAQDSKELEALIDFEATVIELRLSLDTYIDEIAQRGQLDWQKYTASPFSFPNACLELPSLVRFISLPVNAIKLKEQVLAGQMDSFTEFREPVDLCLQVSPDEVFTIYKLSPWQRRIIVAAQKRLSCHDLLQRDMIGETLSDGSLITAVGAMIDRGIIALVDDSQSGL
jgi:uncharacterized protein (UPF0276 family)